MRDGVRIERTVGYTLLKFTSGSGDTAGSSASCWRR
jgi:hypothetical protein